MEQAQHAFGETDDGLVRGSTEDVVISQIFEGPLGGLTHLATAIANIHAPQPGTTIDQLPALPIADAHAIGLGHDVRAFLEVIDNRGVRMEYRLPVDVLEGIVAG